MDEYIVYLITNTKNNCTYIGITNNPERRIRQHNGEIKGGARYTSSKKENGVWEYYAFIFGLNKNEALSIEKKIHIRSRKTNGKNSLDRRIKCINNILAKENENKKDYFVIL